MSRSLVRACISSAFLLASLVQVRLAGAEVKRPSPAEEERMAAAVPEAPAVPPKKPRSLLIFSQCEGYRHESVTYCEKAFEIMGRKTGAFTTTVSSDPAVFESPELDRFDAIVMNNTTMRLPLLDIDTKGFSEEQKAEADKRETAARKRLLDFVARGKGLIGVHAATDCLYKWPEYGELIGGYFAGHPWHEDVTIKLDDPAHPILEPFFGQPFVVKDEIYMFRPAPYSRDSLRVLLSLDTKRTNMDKGSKITRTDNDFAVAWIRSYGQGRVFYFSLGHRSEIFWNPTVMACYLRGIQYAMGDLPADARPSSRLSRKYLSESAEQAYHTGIAKLLERLRSYEVGVDDRAAKTVAALVLENQGGKKGSRREDLSRRLAGLLAGDGTADCRRFVCKQLALIGTTNAVPALARFLADADGADLARYALERIPGDEVDRILVRSLPAAAGRVKVGIIHSLSVRRSSGTVPLLAEALTDGDESVRVAAAAALGNLATRAAGEALLEVRPVGSSTTRNALDLARVACADGLGERRWAGTGLRRELYAAASRDDAPAVARVGAFYCLGLIEGKRSVPAVLAALKGDDTEMRRAAAVLVRDLPGKRPIRRIAAELPGLPLSSRALVLDALAERGGRTALEAVLVQTGVEDETVRLAALRALERVGDRSAVRTLVHIAAAAEDKTEVQKRARQSLARIDDRRVDAELEAIIPQAAPPAKVQAIWALGARKARKRVPVLLAAARDEDKTVRKQARAALALLAGPKDLPALVDLLVESSSSRARAALSTTVVSVSRGIPENHRRVSVLLAALNRELPPAARASLLGVLGRIASPAGLDVLYEAARTGEGEVARAAIKALADWPDPTPLAPLRKLSVNAEDLVLRVLALRGYARQLAMPSDRPIKETLGLYKEAFSLAKQEQEKKTLIAGLANVGHPEALRFLEPFLEDETVRAEALLAAVSIQEALDGKVMDFKASKDRINCRKAVDGTRQTRWTSGARQVGGEWFLADLGYETIVREIRLDAGPVGNDWPRGYEVYVSKDGTTWGEPVVTGAGKEKIFTIELPPTEGRYVKLVQTGTSTGNFWSIAELKINGRPRGSRELERSKWRVSASQSAKDCPPENAIDGDKTKRWGTGRGQKPGDWFMLDLGEPARVCRVILDAARSGNDYPRGYKVFASLDGEKWDGPIGLGKGEKALTTLSLLSTETRFLKIEQTGDGDHWWWSIYDVRVMAE